MKRIFLFIVFAYLSNSLIAQGIFECATTDNLTTNNSKSFACNVTSQDIQNCYQATFNLVFHFIANDNGENFTCDPNDPIIAINSMLYAPTSMTKIVNEMNLRMSDAILGTSNPDAKIGFTYLNGDVCSSSYFYNPLESPQLVSNALNIVLENDPLKPGNRGYVTHFGSNAIYIVNLLGLYLGGSNDYWSIGRLFNHEFGHTRGLNHTFHCNNPCNGIDIDVMAECCGKCYNHNGSNDCWGCSDDELMMAAGSQVHITKCEHEELWCFILDNPSTYQIVTNTCSGPDLIVSAQSINPTIVSCGENILAFTTIQNIGTGLADDSELGYYLSTDQTLDAGDVLINTESINNLASGAQHSVNKTITIPINTNPGIYFVLFVADHENHLIETNEYNNVASQSIQVGCEGPDLVVSSTAVSSTNVRCGDPITAFATVKNIDNFTANSSQLGYFLSTDKIWDANDIAYSPDAIGVLPPGATSNESAVLTIPWGIPSGIYYILFIADAADQLAESYENNNLAYETIYIDCDGPDLTFFQQSFSGNLSCGGTISMITTVRNIGNAPSNACQVGYYLSTDDTWDAGDFQLSLNSLPSIPVGSTEAVSMTSNFPGSLISGIYYVLVVIDVANVIAESDETNNLHSRQVVLICDPDLALSSTVSSSNLTCGENITLSALVTNIGGEFANSSSLGYYLSTDQTWDSGDIQIGSDPVGTLLPGETSNENISWIVPANLTGNYYLLFIADQSNVVTESNETNNLNYHAITIGCPDLAVSASAPSHATCGETITAYALVTNIGNGIANSSTLGYYLSTNATWDASDILIALDPIGALLPGETSTEDATWTVPSNLPTGTYYILLVADEANVVTEISENNNMNVQTIQITCDPDLIISTPSVSPSTVACGGNITAYATVENIGDGPANASLLGYYLSTNTTLEAGDIPLGSDPVGALASGATSNENQLLTIPTGLAPGTYYIIFVADVAYDVTESDETNNLGLQAFTITCDPDLIISAQSVSPSTVACGGNITAYATVENIGDGPANASLLGYYLSTNTTLEAGDIPLGSDPVGSLAAGTSSNENSVLSIPTGLAPGTYYIIFVADVAYDVTESNETNNLGHQAFTITCDPDLIVSAQSVSPSTVECGGTVTAYATVKNIGDGPANASLLGYYLSTNTTLEAGDIPLGSDPVGSLASGATSNEHQLLTIPTGLASGTYYIIFVADVAYDVTESDETNNLGHQAFTILCDPDLIVSEKSVSSYYVTCGQTITAYATVKNIGDATANPSDLGYYLSANTVLDAGDIPYPIDPVGSLAPGATSDESALLTIPTGLATGIYYILFVADVGYDVTESDENNNVAYEPIYVTCGRCKPDPPKGGEIDNSDNIHCTYAYGICNGYTGDYKWFRLTNLSTGVTKNYYSTTHSVLFPNLTPGTDYRYRVRRKCGTSGPYGGWSTFEYFTTPSCPGDGNGDDRGDGWASNIPNSKNGASIERSTDIRNYPNPFNGQTTIEFDLSEDAVVTLFVSDITGSRVAVLLNNEERSRGMHQVTFDGSSHPVGVYYYTIQVGDYFMTRKMILIKN